MATNPLHTTKTGPRSRSNACDSRHSASQISAVIHARHEMATRRRARRSGTPARRSATRAGAALASGVSSSESSQTSSRREEDAGGAPLPDEDEIEGGTWSGGGTGADATSKVSSGRTGATAASSARGAPRSAIFARDHGEMSAARAATRRSSPTVHPSGTSTLADHPRRSVRTVNRIPTPDARPGLGDHGRAWAPFRRRRVLRRPYQYWYWYQYGRAARGMISSASTRKTRAVFQNPPVPGTRVQSRPSSATRESTPTSSRGLARARRKPLL